MDQALVVGVSQYQHIRPIRDNEDAAGVRAVLADPNVCGYPAERVHLLAQQDATRERVLDALDQLGREARASRGRTFFYFSGHGGRDDASGHSYLIPYDARKGEYPTTAISAADVAKRLANDGETTVVLDCCFAGGMGGAIDPGGTALSEFDDSLRNQMAVGNRVVLAASRPDEVSYSSRVAPYGVFTGHMLDGLRGKASTDGCTVNVHELFNYVQKQTLHERRGAQRATFIANYSVPITVARYPQPQAPNVIFEKDVFFSFDRNDDLVADWLTHTLQPELERAGLSVWSTNNTGALGYDDDEEAITKSRYVLSIVTADTLKNRDSHFVRTMGTLQAVHTGTPRFIPILREKLQLPLRLRVFAAIDLSEANLMGRKRQMTLLLDRLKKPPHVK